MSKIKLLGVNINDINVDDAVSRSIELLIKKEKSSIFFINMDCLYKTNIDQSYKKIINSADLVLPDGIGLKLISKYLLKKIANNTNGTDFSPRLLENMASKGYSVFLLGGREGDATKAANNLMKKIPNLKVVGTHHGYFKNDKNIIAKINKSKADVLFVAFGVPKQEKWIYNNRVTLKPKLCLGVGALIDYMSGRIKRAPSLCRRMNLEWFWRILIDPNRMFKRYIMDGAKIVPIIRREKRRLRNKIDYRKK
jgi:exopolysaccharide biosynthesis WecB/TagA/CpsF family protein